MKEFLEKELDKLKIPNGEREYLIEEFVEWRWESFEEDFVKKNGRKPTEKEGRQFVKEYIDENSEYRKPPMRQAEKEKAMRQCLVEEIKYERKHLSVNEMSELLNRCGFTRGASVKTIYRHVLGELAEYNIKKGSDGKYYYDDSYEEQQKINRSIEENELSRTEKKESLTIISNFLETIKDSPAYEKAAAYLENEKSKLKSYTDDETANFSRVLFMGAPEANLKKETWDTIYKAMQTNSPLIISYTSEGKKESAVYGVRPYQLIFDNGCWELWAESLKQKHEGLRLFNLSRISNIRIQEGIHFNLPSDFNFMNRVTGSFGCYIEENQKLYKIKFYKDSYAWLYSKDRIWGANQTVEETEDGYVLSFEANQNKPILRWVLGWGDEVEPIEPEELITEWKNKIMNMSKKLNF